MNLGAKNISKRTGDFDLVVETWWRLRNKRGRHAPHPVTIRNTSLDLRSAHGQSLSGDLILVDGSILTNRTWLRGPGAPPSQLSLWR